MCNREPAPCQHVASALGAHVHARKARSWNAGTLDRDANLILRGDVVNKEVGEACQQYGLVTRRLSVLIQHAHPGRALFAQAHHPRVAGPNPELVP